ncbi:MAG: VWA domain-containing protein [Phycisphaerales bacterium]|jgi:hypothetical protein|nr:VWA domain-containing protein [Phycisphaerales bacterium]
MGIEFQCEECGQLINVDAEPGAEVACTHCGAGVIVPAALASLPQPQVDGAAPLSPETQYDAPGDEAPDGEYYDEEGEELEDEQEEGDMVMTIMANSMPWIISIFFHVGLAMLFFMVIMIAAVPDTIDPVTIPSATFSEKPGSTVSHGRTSKVNKATQRHRKVKAAGESTRELEVPNEGKTGEATTLIGASAGAGGGELAAFGMTDGGGGPRLGMYGTGGNAHHVVYLIDRSGSMFDTFDAVKKEIGNSVGQLNPVQDFHVIMFADGDPLEKQPRALTPPSDTYKFALAEFLDTVIAESTTNPVKAINRAFDVLAKANKNPGKIIYMLTDGAFPDNTEVLTTIRARNGRRDVLINTFLYGNQQPVAEKVLTTIAEENGGKYRYVSPDE